MLLMLHSFRKRAFMAKTGWKKAHRDELENVCSGQEDEVEKRYSHVTQAVGQANLPMSSSLYAVSTRRENPQCLKGLSLEQTKETGIRALSGRSSTNIEQNISFKLLGGSSIAIPADFRLVLRCRLPRCPIKARSLLGMQPSEPLQRINTQIKNAPR